jgi:membrane protease YdiL (CAAX protease family)
MALAVLLSPDGRLRPWWRFLIATALFLLCQLALSQVLRPSSLISVESIVGFALLLAINVTVFAALSRVLDRASKPLAYMGFARDTPVLRQIVVGVLFGSAMVSLAVVAIAIGGSTMFRWEMTSVLLRAAAAQLVLFPIAALNEEIAFRGYPFQRLTESIGAIPAVIVLSVLFALPHLGNPNSTMFAGFNTAAVGALLAVAYLLTRTLWFVWGIHTGWNVALAVAYGLSVSGFDTDGPVNGSVTGPEWLTGGAYGIEGGASGSIAIVVGFGVLLWLVRQPVLVGTPAPPPSNYVVTSSTESSG